MEDEAVLARVVEEQVTLEVCPGSNVALGVYGDLGAVPLPRLLEVGARVALGADDPLLFGSRLADQYVSARMDHGLDDDALARLARGSIEGSVAAPSTKRHLLAEVDAWLDTPAPPA